MKRGRIEDDDSPDRIMARYNRGACWSESFSTSRGGRARGRRVMSEVAITPYRIPSIASTRWCCVTGTFMSSWPRLLELIYWPALQIITWGFLQNYISQTSGFFAQAGGTLIGAVILWDILFRGQLGFSISFLEEMWARNLGNLTTSPLKPIEFLISR